MDHKLKWTMKRSGGGLYISRFQKVLLNCLDFISIIFLRDTGLCFFLFVSADWKI